MKARLTQLHSPGIDLDLYSPEDPQMFGFLLEASFGPEEELGVEYFNFMVCSPRWLEAECKGRVMSARHYLITDKYDLDAIKQHLEMYCESCTGDSWEEIALKLARFGRWEFEDYRP